MRRLWLAGESLPLKEDGTLRRARKSTNLPETLVPLDPRHGVFPNLVMKPLFAAGFVLSQKNADKLLEYFKEMETLVADNSDRRFNVFENRVTKPKKRDSDDPVDPIDASEIFELRHQGLLDLVVDFDVREHLWLVFGHQTNFGLLWWLLNKDIANPLKRQDLRNFSSQFVVGVKDVPQKVACGDNSQLSSRIGLFHRLCTGANFEEPLAKTLNRPEYRLRYSAERTLAILRSIVPLLHNEGYQDASHPTGNAQAHFVEHATGENLDGDLYWQVMGNAIATRLLGSFVE